MAKLSNVYISTYGCQMNTHDTERMYSLLEMNNYTQVEKADEADLIIINSCSVREKPVHKVMSEIGTYRDLKSRHPALRIGVGGCVGQQEGKKLLKDAPLLDFVFGTDTIDMLPQILRDLPESGRTSQTQMEHRAPYQIETMVRNPRVSAFVTITKGCDNFCSFCVVPFTRGREKSRLLGELLKDIRSLVARGVREVTLLGQNVNSYESPDGAGGFTTLLKAVCIETEIERVRFTTSHPKDFDDSLIEILIEHQGKLGHYMHLPVQSGSSRILDRMNRGYTREEYSEKIKKLKDAMPEVALSTDIIVGFPGETREDFQETVSLIEEMRFENVYSFKYSPRPFTKALKYKEQVPESEKDSRLEQLNGVQDKITFELCKKYDNGIYNVLVEGPSRTQSEVLTGRTTHNKVINFLGDKSFVGKTIPVKVIQSLPYSLRGEIVLDS